MAVALTLLTAGVLLLGPLWDDPRGENPLERPSGVDWDAVLMLGLPTLMVAASLVVALALPRHRLVAGLAALAFGYAVLRAPDLLTVWFLPALVLTAAGFGLGVWDARAQERGAAHGTG